MKTIFQPKKTKVGSRRWGWGCSRRNARVTFEWSGRTHLTNAQRHRMKNTTFLQEQKQLKDCMKVVVLYIYSIKTWEQYTKMFTIHQRS